MFDHDYDETADEKARAEESVRAHAWWVATKKGERAAEAIAEFVRALVRPPMVLKVRRADAGGWDRELGGYEPNEVVGVWCENVPPSFTAADLDHVIHEKARDGSETAKLAVQWSRSADWHWERTEPGTWVAVDR